MPRITCLLLLAPLALLSASAAAQPAAPATTTAASATAPATQPKPLAFAEVIQRGDRVLFVGDDMTQQMFYTRAVAAGLLAIHPDFGLRFFNGGYDGAKAGDALTWIDGLLDLAQPTVVFACFGLNDAAAPAPLAQREAQYRQDLTALVRRVQARAGVRQVIVLSPPALAGALDPNDKLSYSVAVLAVAKVAYQVAVERGVGFIDLYSHLSVVHEAEVKAGGAPLTIGGRVPSEAGHIVIASAVLAGIGVTAADLDAVHWSPLPPRKMQVVRGVLALKLKKVTVLEDAQKSNYLYESIRPHDEAFFKLWRLAGKRPHAQPREALVAAAEEAWNDVAAAAREGYGTTPATAPGAPPGAPPGTAPQP